tara:strand:- start:213 stop:671 length:459 start_codon:yes stop_codon:yes gene_type:complete
MNYKKKSLILSFFLILSIQIILLINNRTKTSFRYFIWNIEEVNIGRLISISFVSGLLISSLINYTLSNDFRIYPKNEEDKKTNPDNENLINNDEDNVSYEMPPERDLRDTQPTISVNYRVIKDNDKNELRERNQMSQNTENHDDWGNIDSDW